MRPIATSHRLAAVLTVTLLTQLSSCLRVDRMPPGPPDPKDRTAAVMTACRTGMADAGELDEGPWYTKFGEECADLFVTPSCQASARTPPGRGMVVAVEACGDSVCIDLPSPKPWFCSTATLARGQGWHELAVTALSGSLGLPPADVEAFISELPKHSTWELGRTGPKALKRAPDVMIVSESAGVRVTIGRESRDFGDSPDVARVTDWVRSRLAHPRRPVVVVEKDAATDISLVRAVIDGAHAVGLIQFDFRAPRE